MIARHPPSSAEGLEFVWFAFTSVTMLMCSRSAALAVAHSSCCVSVVQKIVKIDQLLPDHCRGLRARLYHVLMLPTTIMSKVLLQQQLLDESHVLGTAESMVGTAEAKQLCMIGFESLKETGIVPSGIPNTVLFNNVAYIKPVTVHPALATVAALGVAARVEQPVPVVNRVYDSYPKPEAGPMFAPSTANGHSSSSSSNGTTAAPSYNTSFASVPNLVQAATRKAQPNGAAASSGAANPTNSTSNSSSGAAAEGATTDAPSDSVSAAAQATTASATVSGESPCAAADAENAERNVSERTRTGSGGGGSHADASAQPYAGTCVLRRRLLFACCSITLSPCHRIVLPATLQFTARSQFNSLRAVGLNVVG
jgi:hypothetical protein